MTVSPLSWLYAPVSRPDLATEALASRAHVAIRPEGLGAADDAFVDVTFERGARETAILAERDGLRG